LQFIPGVGELAPLNGPIHQHNKTVVITMVMDVDPRGSQFQKHYSGQSEKSIVVCPTTCGIGTRCGTL
jgi:hypothetical protein